MPPVHLASGILDLLQDHGLLNGDSMNSWAMLPVICITITMCTKGSMICISDTVEINRTGEYCSDLFADAAIDFIREKTKSADPWFVYLPFNAPHFPSQANQASRRAKHLAGTGLGFFRGLRAFT